MEQDPFGPELWQPAFQPVRTVRRSACDWPQRQQPTVEPLRSLELELSGINLIGHFLVDLNLGLEMFKLLATILARFVDVHDPVRHLFGSRIYRKLAVWLALTSQFSWSELRR